VAENAAPPTPAETLRAALEKIVFFEWRISELAGELSAMQARATAAEAARGRAEEAADAALQTARNARREAAELESERARLAALLARPAHPPVDAMLLEQERRRSAQLARELDEARRELSRQAAERDRWLSEMIAQARNGDEAPAALAEFISELRGEIIALRADKVAGEQRSLVPSAPVNSVHHAEPPVAPALTDEVRVRGPSLAPVETTHFAQPEVRKLKPVEPPSGAARALVDLCLRNLTARDASRREQAARHLAAVPLASAAPSLASALGVEREPKVRAQLARALIACGGEGAAEMVALLQSPQESPLVRMAAAEALSTRAAIEAAAADASPAVRRRAAALAAAQGFTDLLDSLSLDADASVRAAAAAAQNDAPEAAKTEAAPPPVQEEPALPATGGARQRGALVEEPDTPAGIAIHAVQAALFGLTDGELAERIGVPENEALALAAQLVAEGRLSRRGKRLVAAKGAGAAGDGRRPQAGASEGGAA
jgi:hypothetical protein